MPLPLLALAAVQSFCFGNSGLRPARLHKKEIAGQPAEVLVLGTPHLSQLADIHDPRSSSRCWSGWRASIPRSSRSRPLGRGMRHAPAVQVAAWRGYLGRLLHRTAEIEKTTGLDVPAATAKPTPRSPRGPRTLGRSGGTSRCCSSRPTTGLRDGPVASPSRRRNGAPATASTQAMVDMILRKGKPPNENYTIGRGPRGPARAGTCLSRRRPHGRHAAR